ncbi:hypothetical protein GCM10010358_23810 [Streptomyces minutiscleroticus]|uniref:Uncharacterized protein n=1 Tax=Streptomyces minutiscleroticus TaxID=68238 RepID=A0A918KME3_9ACTN|nr:hypothetical protein GCM10010358_23810 [Streptomyces minutiscleroticus]
MWEQRQQPWPEPGRASAALKDDDALRTFLLSQDVIYAGGGNTANLLAVWREHGVDRLLREVFDRGDLAVRHQRWCRLLGRGLAHRLLRAAHAPPGRVGAAVRLNLPVLRQ